MNGRRRPTAPRQPSTARSSPSSRCRSPRPDLVPHGALVTGLGSTDVAASRRRYSLPAAGSADSTPPTIGDAAFPGTLAARRDLRHLHLDRHGTGSPRSTSSRASSSRTRPRPGAARSGSSTRCPPRCTTSRRASPLANDYTPATIDSTQAVTARRAGSTSPSRSRPRARR